MAFGNLNTVSDYPQYSEELIKKDFSSRLIATENDCEDWYNHCRKHNMKFCKGTYGTLVHKDFDKYFKLSRTHKSVREILGIPERASFEGLDHTNIFYYKHNKDIKMVTSSPYDVYTLDMFQGLEHSAYSLYVIHPELLDYYAFVCRTDSKYEQHPLSELNYAFLKGKDAEFLNNVFMDELGMRNAFVLLKEY